MQANFINVKMSRLLMSCLSRKIQIGLTSFFMTFGIIHNAYAVPAQVPLFQLNSVKPIMMLNMSRDHQLFFKVYDDYSDITNSSGGAPDGIPDRGFVGAYDYYGYFDSGKCYTYNTSNNRFEPSRVTDPNNKSYCNYIGGVTNEWSGNFLNWASMTRMDAIRKILYGGYRSTDSNTDTVLERAFLPHDAHSFAKFYDGNDVNKLTPFTVPQLQSTAATGITICNTTAATGYSQLTTAAPLIRVAKGNYTLWASNERWQCLWGTTANGNNATASGINAYPTAPSSAADKLGTGSAAGEYYVRVQVCKENLKESNCIQYPSATYPNKPIGLLQEYGETGKLNFGLITGTYGKNKSGGVLRKNVGDMLDEINTTTYGTFKPAPGTGGIINTLNLFRLYGYSYSAGDMGSYANASPGTACGYGLSTFTEGNCANWGNPQSEIYYESLRYLAGATRSTAYSNSAATTDADYISGLTQATWTAPVTNSNSCAPLNVLQFNASSNSYDIGLSSSYVGLDSIGLDSSTLDSATNKVGDLESITNTLRFVGRLTSTTGGDQLCTAKTIDKLSNVSGTCPDSPRLDGGYSMVGLARHARKTGIPIVGLSAPKTVRTYGVALAPALPKIEVPVPNSSTNGKVVIQPACRNHSTGSTNTNCAIVDFKIVDQKTNVTLTGYSSASGVNGTVGNTGKLYVNWEDSEQGGDYDQDMWGVINYAVTAAKVVITTQVFAQSTPNSMGFGYVLTGTNRDGFNVQSGINNFIYGTTCTAASGNKCTCRPDGNYAACATGADYLARAQVFDVASSTATFLESPLYYAAKWGGYSSDFAKENAAALDTAITNRTPADSYYFATDPRALAESLRNAFNDISAGVGAATSVATVSAKVGEGDFVYQAQFNSQNWSGALQAYAFDNKGILKTVPGLCSANVLDPDNQTVTCTGAMPSNSSSRTILFNKSGLLTPFSWPNLTTDQQASLKLASETSTVEAVKRVDWLSGNATYETTAKDGTLRDRGVNSSRNILGDIVNSSPVYVGDRNFKYNNLPSAAGAKYLKFVEDKKEKEKLLVVGSNDGMLHAFDATNFAEKFAFIPNLAFPKLAKLTMPDYGKSINPHSYIVDGPLTYSDAYINGSWRRIVAGTMGAGGRGVFALDITDPTPKLLFEITNANYPSLGYVLGKPTILPMKNDRWAVIFGNGYDSGSTSRLFVVDLEKPLDPAFTKILDTGEGTGLSAPAIEINGNGEAVNVYAGDLNGNLWRFDLQNTSASSWQKSYKLFKAVDAGVEQPITASPTLGINSSKDWKTMVYFGTGKYFDVGDEGTNIKPQAFYAIADVGTTVALSSLLNKTMVTTGTTKRELSPKIQNPTWATQNGWYLLFNDTNTKGERVIAKPLLLFDKLIFQTLIPSINACDNGGASWLMEVPAVGDKYKDKTLLSPNEYNPLTLGDLSFIVNISTGEGSIISNPSASKSNPDQTIVPLPVSLSGRQSWHQVQ